MYCHKANDEYEILTVSRKNGKHGFHCETNAPEQKLSRNPLL